MNLPADHHLDLLSHATEDNWEATDPDVYQYGRTILPGVYQFRQLKPEHLPDADYYEEDTYEQQNQQAWNDPRIWVDKTIRLDDYSEAQQQEFVAAFYGTLGHLYQQHGADGDFLLAECIFEQVTPELAI